MQQALEQEVVLTKERREWARLVRKLRWIGLDDEAQRLERALSTLPPEERGTVSAGPINTD